MIKQYQHCQQNRAKQVVIDGEATDPTPDTSGVGLSQGTVLLLGLLIFLLYINDIGDNVGMDT